MFSILELLIVLEYRWIGTGNIMKMPMLRLGMGMFLTRLILTLELLQEKK